MKLNFLGGERSKQLQVDRSNHGMAIIFPEYVPSS